MKKGDKVKCIDDYFEDSNTNPFHIREINIPKENQNYTIREVVRTDYGTGVRLVEVINKKYYFKNINREEEPIFGSNRFKSLKK
ncbi:hypothetical protein M0R72_04170 [Candidatus Pacearchaeota archaeon]|jgi:hypothetical protein|nr:hypothetical protein [Candidatus Pacearchaeota archaeon]